MNSSIADMPNLNMFDPLPNVQRYVRLIDFVYHSTLGLRVIKKKKMPKLNMFDPLLNSQN